MEKSPIIPLNMFERILPIPMEENSDSIACIFGISPFCIASRLLPRDDPPREKSPLKMEEIRPIRSHIPRRFPNILIH